MTPSPDALARARREAGRAVGLGQAVAADHGRVLLDEIDRLTIAVEGCGCPAPYDHCTHDEPLTKTVERVERERIRAVRSRDDWKAIAQACEAGRVKVTGGMLADWLDAMQRGNDIVFGHAEAQGLADAIDRLTGERDALRNVARELTAVVEPFAAYYEASMASRYPKMSDSINVATISNNVDGDTAITVGDLRRLMPALRSVLDRLDDKEPSDVG
jgi:hypothetical protein